MPFEHPHLDAYGNAIFAEKLQAARVQSYDARFPELIARRLVPVNNSDDPGADTIVWESYTTVGAYKLISAYADDLPRSDIAGEKNVVSVRDLGGSYGYNINEVTKSVYAGAPLPPRKAAAMRRSYEQEIDRLIATGDSVTGLVGLLNQPNATIFDAPDGAGLSAEWEDKTPEEIYSDLVLLRRTVRTTTKGIEDVNTIILPDEQYGIIEDTIYSTNSDSSILEVFKSKNPGIEVLPWFRAAGAGVGGTDRAAAYRRDPNYVECIIPKELTELEPEQRNLETLVNSHARFGGVVCFYPLSMAYMDGI